MKMIKLTPRLSAVASLVEKCDVAADIGTDHGFIPTYLVQNDICLKAIASDINKGPLQSAVRTAQNYGVTDKLNFVCAPGLDGIEVGSVDAVVIAGMGGETIVDILSAAEWLKEFRTQLILQPQSKFELFENYLNVNGYSVSSALLVKDAGRLYVALSARYSGSVIEKDITYFVDLLKDDPLLVEYVEGILKKLSLRKTGLLSATVLNTGELEFIEKTESYLKNVLLEANDNGNG